MIALAILTLLGLGAVAGFLAGLLGIGGGAVLVPGLYYLLTSFGYSEVAMHTAVGTSLLTIVFTGSSSARAHYLNHAVDLQLVKQFVPGILLGVILGTFLATFLTTTGLKLSFAVLQILFGLYMLMRGQTLALFSALPSQPWFTVFATLNAALAALMGVGGGLQNVLYLTICNHPLAKAIGTASALGPIIALLGAFGFWYIGQESTNLPPFSLGFIHFPAFLCIITTSVAMAPFGARLTHQLPTAHLKKLFTFFLFGISLKMLYEVFGTYIA